MRIAIDYTAGIRQGAGVGHYVRSLVAAMLAQDTEDHFLFLTSGRPTQEHSFPVAANATGRSLLIPDRYLNILWYRLRAPLYANYFTGPIDIYHGPDFGLPPLTRTVRKIVTVHDLAFLEHPETAVPALAAYLRKIVPQAVHAADVVAAVSHTTKQALMKHYQVPEQKITVIPCGVGPQFRRITDPTLLATTREKFGLTQPFILSVGTLEPRKNHLGLIKAFYEIQKNASTPTILAIAGGNGWLYEETRQMVVQLDLSEKVRFLGRVSEPELLSLYSMAEIFAFPSFFEGFGIPPLEAMACGAPVITSRTSSLPEVVGDAALLVDPYDISSIADALLRLLGDASLRENLREKGYARAQHFTWARAASKMLSVYQDVYAGKTDFSDDTEEKV